MTSEHKSEIGVWKVADGLPKRFERTAVEIERHLEDWLEHDGSLIQSGLYIVGRQVRTQAGPLDLLGLDLFGRWAVIEIKRGQLRRETVAQAIDYAACIAELSDDELRAVVEDYLTSHGMTLRGFLEHLKLDTTVFNAEQRDIMVFVVGTTSDTNLERLTRHLSFRGQPINAVTFEVFEDTKTGERILIRKLTELDESPSAFETVTSNLTEAQVSVSPTHRAELERLFALAQKNGIGEEFQLIHDTATKYGLFPRTYKWSIMYTPPANKTRVLICAWVKPKRGLLEIVIGRDAFKEFYQVSDRDIAKLTGGNPRPNMNTQQTREFAAKLDRLLQKITAN